MTAYVPVGEQLRTAHVAGAADVPYSGKQVLISGVSLKGRMDNSRRTIRWALVGGGVVGIGALAAVVAGVTHATAGRALPNVSVGHVDVGGLSSDDAARRIAGAVERLRAERVRIIVDGAVVAEPTFAELGVRVPAGDLARDAIGYGRGPVGVRQAMAWVRGVLGVRLPLRAAIEEPVFRETARSALAAILAPPRSANWAAGERGTLALVPAIPGREVDMERLARGVLDRFLERTGEGVDVPVDVPVTEVPPDVSDAEARALKPDVEDLLARPFTLALGERRWTVPSRLRRSWIALERSDGRARAMVAAEPLAAYLLETIASGITTPARNARFMMSDGRVAVFALAEEGTELDLDASVRAIRTAVARGLPEAFLIVRATRPAITTTADIERLGVTTLLGRGESDFSGSPRNRIHNIRLGAAQFHGVLIPPGAEFGFNETLGPVRPRDGYKPELVILHDATAPQYGGGLCQVSTTAFRAAVVSGLPITERRNHAYPVSYYGIPGFDATIYPNQRTWRDGTDLKFLNDTPGHILIQTRVEGTKLLFEFWGSSDGREVKLVGPTPYGRKPDGSLKATLTQQVYREGTLVREETFASAYKSPKLFPRVLAANAERETWEEKVKRVEEKDRKVHEEFLQKQRQDAAAAEKKPKSP